MTEAVAEMDIAETPAEEQEEEEKEEEPKLEEVEENFKIFDQNSIQNPNFLSHIIIFLQNFDFDLGRPPARSRFRRRVNHALRRCQARGQFPPA